MPTKRKQNLPIVHEVMEEIERSCRERHPLSKTEYRTSLFPLSSKVPATKLSSSSSVSTHPSKFQKPLISFPEGVLMRSWSRNAGALSYPITLTIFLLTASLLSSTVFCASTEDEELVCQKGVTGFPGATFPRGDILIQAGDTLEVYCRLNLAKSRGYNASFIQFIFTKSDIPPEAIKTTVINETTALLQVQKMNVSSPHLSCEIAPPGAQRGRFIQVCQNEIDVGYPPLPVEDFRCIVRDWRSLNCTWKKPYNPIPTNYALVALQRWNKQIHVRVCPNNTTTPTSCIWGPRTEPFYIANQNPLYFRINGTNVLNPGGVTWNVEIDHWSIVVPATPTHVKKHHVTSNNVTVNWNFDLFTDLQPGLYHQLRVCIIEAPDVPCNVTTLKSSKGMNSMEHNFLLYYAYVNYTVEIRMRSQRAKDEAEFWSTPASIVLTSGPQSPYFSPRVDIGSFESVSTTLETRDIYLYWEDVPRLQQNGPGFKYIFNIYENGQRHINIQPAEITRSYAKFSALGMMSSYRFLIQSANDVGNSSTMSEIFVPKNNKAPAQPRSVSKLDFTNGSFEVSWHRPVSETSIVSYTVFRCSSSKPRPYQCQGLVEWDVVNSAKQTRQIYNYLPHHNDKIYQFAVSANSDNKSSGMVWASCTLIHNKVPEKLKRVEKILEQEKEIHVEWQLDCSYQPGVIEGYKITYCLVAKTKPDRCIDDEKSEAVQGADKTIYNLKGLKPFSTYMIAVSVLARAGESQKSDPIYATTKESAPSTPPIGQVEQVTNTTASIKIYPPESLNGILQKYKINYKSVDDPTEQGQLVVPVNLTAAKNSQLDNLSTEAVIPHLVSNANYSYTISACTVHCSEESASGYFMTKIGYTNFKTYPSLVMSSSGLVLEWNKPEHLGGPVRSFEILIRQDGKVKEGDVLEVKFQDDIVNYQKDLNFPCETVTNYTAQVRAVTELETGEVVNGEWSPPGNYNCGGGGASWIMWMIVVIAAILTITVIGIGSTKVYQYVKQMKEFDVKLPPGLAVQDLNGFYPKRTRKNSDGDTQSFGKENLTYQLQMTSTNHSDESKDFLPLTESSLREPSKTEFSFELDLSYDNKGYSEGLDLHQISENHDSNHSGLWDCRLGPENIIESPYSHAEVVITIPIADESSNPSRNDEDESIDKRTSPSPSERLLDDSEMTEEDDSPQAHLQLISHKHQPNYNIVESIVLGNGSTLIHNSVDSDDGDHIEHQHSNILPQSPPDRNFNLHQNQNPTLPQSLSPDRATNKSIPPIVPPDVLNPSTIVKNGEPSRFTNTNPSVPSSNNVSLPPPPSSSYVTWTQLGMECKNGDTSLGIGDNSRRSPYCQVGILLDSN